MSTSPISLSPRRLALPRAANLVRSPDPFLCRRELPLIWRCSSRAPSSSVPMAMLASLRSSLCSHARRLRLQSLDSSRKQNWESSTAPARLPAAIFSIAKKTTARLLINQNLACAVLSFIGFIQDNVPNESINPYTSTVMETQQGVIQTMSVKWHETPDPHVPRVHLLSCMKCQVSSKFQLMPSAMGQTLRIVQESHKRHSLIDTDIVKKAAL